MQLPEHGQQVLLNAHGTEAQWAGADIFPVSRMQESLWVLEQIAPGNPAYNHTEAWRLEGALNTKALEASFQALVNRHEILRTVFGTKDNQPIQIIRSSQKFSLQTADLTGAVDREAQLSSLLRSEAGRPFDLQTGPLIRAALFKLGPEQHALCVNLHHIISDEWSFRVLTRDLADHYNCFQAGKQPRIPELPIQYADFAVWQRETLGPQKLKEDLAYWKEKLQGPLPTLGLPSDKRRPARFSWKGQAQFISLPDELRRGLGELSRLEGVTLFMTLLAAFKVLLHRYTRQTDIIVGSPFAGRDNTETENLIGLFVNTHALRSDLSGDPAFTELLRRTREVVLGACAHQSPAVDQVIDAVNPERDTARHPLFQVVLGLQPAETAPWSLSGLTASTVEIDNGSAKFDWTLLLTETKDGFRLRSEYSTDVFDHATMEGAVRHFGMLLRSILANPAARISELPLLTPAERHEVLLEGNQAPPNASPRVKGNCIHSSFEEQAALRPDSTALVFGGEALTYAELNSRANQLAHYLRKLGAVAGKPIALYLDRSFDLVVAILGTLKAGSPYVPIDPAHPAEYLNFVLEDTRAEVVVTQQKFRARFGQSGRAVICLDLDQENLALETRSNPTSRPAEADPAYIIYTSGSTGQPKGVLVTHGNVVRLFQQTENFYGFNSNDVWTLFHSYTFDFSVWEIWGALLYGGRLIVVPYMTSRSPADFYQMLAREKVTVLNQTPSAFRQLVGAEETLTNRPALSLRYVICGGESLELQSLRPWFQRHGDEKPRIINVYGITETTVLVTNRIIRQQDLENDPGSVIGDIIPDLKVYLLDDNLQPVPRGVPGEICVGGPGVALGYLNRPELTAKRFVPDPFSGEPGATMYRSGDLARRSSDGEFLYLGRMDHQVKIRGFRVELGAIESALNRHPAIRESIVLAHDGPGGEKQLVGYVVAPETAPAPQEIREHLARILPEYMIPAVFVPLARLPLTHNGKVDRRALPAPGAALSPGRTIVQPRNETELALLRIWKEVLVREDLGVHDNFFHLGGHSLLATQVISRLNAHFQAELSVATIFEVPTVAGLAQVIAQGKPGTSRQGGPIRPLLEREDPEQLLSHLDDLSEAEVEQLLGKVS